MGDLYGSPDYCVFMGKCKKRIDWKVFLRAFLTVTVVAVICVVFSILGMKTDFFSPFKQAADSYNITDLYMYYHWRQDVPSYDGTSVVLVDISSCRTRSEIAEAIDRINACGPRIVALDIIFPEAVSSDPKEDSTLVASLSRVGNLVLATEMRPVSGMEYSRMSSFFVEETGAVEGVVTLPSGVIREWTPIVPVGDVQYTSFTKAITDILSVPVPETDEFQLINYAISDPLVVDASEEWDPDFLKDQIVLLGDVKDARDTYQVPVSLRSSTRQSGVFVHKQILMTCLSQDYFRRVPAWLEYLVSILILFMISTILSPILVWAKKKEDELEDKFKDTPEKYTLKDCVCAFLYHHAAGFMQTALIVFAVIAGYLLFWTCGCIFDLTFLLAGFVLLYVSHKFVVAVLKLISRLSVIFKNRAKRK
jgi:uncharacterized Tic20 family protein